jgi:sugar phosphate isomerase/epimerase
MAVVDGKVVQTEVGEGNLDWPEILSACADAGTEWLVVEQDESTRDPLESLALSFRNLAAMMSEPSDRR